MLSGIPLQSALIDTDAVAPYHPNLDEVSLRDMEIRITALVIQQRNPATAERLSTTPAFFLTGKKVSPPPSG